MAKESSPLTGPGASIRQHDSPCYIIFSLKIFLLQSESAIILMEKVSQPESNPIGSSVE